MDDETKDKSNSDWIRLQREEEDRRIWLWKLITRLGLWIAALVAGARELIGALKDFGWWPPHH